ncbi:hypothetical protein JTM01_39840, partial [Pseudomonas aeruginosa]|nr:hypothetical protein [Pseudomonas aeruginosa]
LDGATPVQLLGLDLHQFGDERKGRFIDAKRLRQITSKSMKLPGQVLAWPSLNLGTLMLQALQAAIEFFLDDACIERLLPCLSNLLGQYFQACRDLLLIFL